MLFARPVVALTSCVAPVFLFLVYSPDGASDLFGDVKTKYPAIDVKRE